MTKENKDEGNERTWCCWTLNEKEIRVIAEGMEVELTEDQIDEIIEAFQDAIREVFSNWEQVLYDIIDRVTCEECKKLDEKAGKLRN